MKFNNDSGFSLLEVVIALGIMGSVMILLTSGWRGNLNRVKKTKLKTQASFLLQRKMSEIEMVYKDQIQNLPKDLQKGKFKDKALKKYSWEWKAADFKMPDLKKLLLSEEQQGDSTAQSVAQSLQTFFETSIKEVRLTLIYKASESAPPQRTSLATIMVDYYQPLNLGFGGAQQ